MPAHERKLEDRRRLKAAFAATFDRSRIETLLLRPDGWEREGLRPWGEGTCFETWLLARRGGEARGAGLDLVVKRARPEWLAGEARQVDDWLSSLQALRTEAGLLLVPPFEVVRAGAELALVMPRGEVGTASAAPHWQPVEAEVRAFVGAMAEKGLGLGDVPQLAVWEGVPFVYDLSDVSGRRSSDRR